MDGSPRAPEGSEGVVEKSFKDILSIRIKE
jgi:hypothetical protein